MFSWLNSNSFPTYKVQTTQEYNDAYILDNAIRLPKSALPKHAPPSRPDELYLAYLQPILSESNTYPVIYPIILDDNLNDNEVLENSQIRERLQHPRNSSQPIEIKLVKKNKFLPVVNITLQIIQTIPKMSNKQLMINEEKLTQLIRERFLNHFPLNLSQVLVVNYSMEDPRYEGIHFPEPKLVDLRIVFKVNTINHDQNLSSHSNLYQLEQNSHITFKKRCSLAHFNLISSEEEKQYQVKKNEEKAAKNREIFPEEKNNFRRNNNNTLKNDDIASEHIPIEPLPFTIEENADQESPHLPTSLSFDFTQYGIGGNQEVIDQLVSQIYSPRVLSPFTNNYDAKPVKGILLFGPPGTGKTSIAKSIANIFPKEIKVKLHLINGPELRSKFVGESEEKLRSLFEEAQLDWLRKKEKSPLHIIIFDEIDATFSKRGTRSNGTGIDDNMISQMLGLMDGLIQIENVLVIGTTNRPELLDEALKRENRFSLAIEIGLPNFATRKEILALKTKQLSFNHLLDENIDLEYWAHKTVDFSGADLEQLVRVAQNHAQVRNFDYDYQTHTLTLKKCVIESQQLEKVTIQDFERSYLDIKPLKQTYLADSKSKQELFIVYDAHIQSIIEEYQSCVKKLNDHHFAHQINFLLTGESGTGKTALVKYLSEKTGCNEIKWVTPDQLLGKAIQVQLEFLEDIFNSSRESKIIIFDNLEGILRSGGEKICQENTLLLKFISLINAEVTNKCIIIATVKQDKILNNINLYNYFDEIYRLHKLCLSPEKTASLELIAHHMNFRFVTKNDIAFFNELHLSIKQIIYIFQKIVTDDFYIDAGLFFKTAQNLLKQQSNLTYAHKIISFNSSIFSESSKRNDSISTENRNEAIAGQKV